MTRYWVIAPVESQPPGLFDKVWQFDLANNLISIGWSEAGDFSKMSRDELSAAIASAYPEKPPGAKGLVGNMLWAFYHDVAPGDFVVARRGLKTIAAAGKSTNRRSMHRARTRPSTIPISWELNGRNSPATKASRPLFFGCKP